MFQRNGRSGYVLKPEALRCPEKDLLLKYTQHFLDVTVRSPSLEVPLLSNLKLDFRLLDHFSATATPILRLGQ